MDNQGAVAMLRCRRCRKGFVDATCLHPIVPDDNTEAAGTCSVWHMNVDTLPEWILTSVHQAQWAVGKLNCENCGARLGGFNFLNSTKCPCGQQSSVHLSKSRVDQDHKHSLHVVRPQTTRGRGGPGCLKGEPGGSHSEQDRSEVGEDFLVGSQLCCTSVSRLNAESQPITTHPDAFYQLADIRATQSVPLSSPSIVSHRKSGARGRLEPSCSSDSQTGPVEETEGEVRTRTEQLHPSPGLSYTPHLLATSIIRSPTCLSPLTREAPGSPLLSLRGPGVSHIPGEQEEDVEEDVEEERWGTPTELQAQLVAANASPALQRFSKREKNRLKSQRRKQRKKERWLHSQEQSVTGLLTDSEEVDREGYTCAVCLDVYFSPYSCHPCGHIFCEPCLRTLAKNRPANTPCPLCRTLISHTLFQKELNQTAKTFFPKVYHSRKHNFQKANCAKLPLPNCQKRFRIFWGYQRQEAPGRWWHFAPAGFALDALDLADMRGWFFDIDLVIIYIHSVNWILALLVLCLLAYFFLS
ncbi:E3 ubiquitin-protein ligase RNF180 [Coregonus clupeaformis]|nr:E3 ubiquitin-protein ligase RNF180 [Coregonus clupeaformis]